MDGHKPDALAAAGLVIAYEPVWAIGTGRNARGVDANAMADVIRITLAERGWEELAGTTPVLYGGSVTSANIGEFVGEPAIDGEGQAWERWYYKPCGRITCADCEPVMTANMTPSKSPSRSLPT